MDMSKYGGRNSSLPSNGEYKLLRHCEAIRRNKDSIGAIFLFLIESPPNASAAKECFDEISHEDQKAIYSVSTKAGGIWERWERDAIFYGDLDATSAWSVWCKRLHITIAG